MPKWLQDAETQVAQTPNMLNSIMTQTDKLQMIDGATQYAAAVANDAGSQTEQKRYTDSATDAADLVKQAEAFVRASRVNQATATELQTAEQATQ